MRNMMIEEGRIGQDRSPQAADRKSVKPISHFDHSKLQDGKLEQADAKKDEKITLPAVG